MKNRKSYSYGQNTNHGFVRFDALTGEHAITPTVVCYADDESGGGDDKSKGKTFTQEDLDKVVQARVAKEAAKHEKLQAQVDKLSKAADAAEAMKAELAATKAALEDAGKGDIEKELNQAKRQIESLNAKLKKSGEELSVAQELQGKADASLRTHVVETAVRSALLQSGVLPKAVEQATRLLMADAELVEDKKGKSTVKLTVGDIDFAPDEGAAEWLKENAHFAKAVGGGSGTKAPTAGPGVTPSNLDDQPVSSLLATGLAAERD